MQLFASSVSCSLASAIDHPHEIEGGVTPASQPGRPRSVCVIESRACHVTSHRVFVWGHLKICTPYKIVYSMVDFPDAPIRFDSSPYSTRSHHSLSIASYPSKSNQFSGSFFPSSTKLWNSLSYDVISLSNFLSFKKCTKP